MFAAKLVSSKNQSISYYICSSVIIILCQQYETNCLFIYFCVLFSLLVTRKFCLLCSSYSSLLLLLSFDLKTMTVASVDLEVSEEAVTAEIAVTTVAASVASAVATMMMVDSQLPVQHPTKDR